MPNLVRLLVIFTMIFWQALSIANSNQPLSCIQAQTLFAPQILPASDDVIVSADESSVTNKENYHLSGDAELKSNRYYLKADEIFYTKSEKKAVATGSVNFQNKHVFVLGDKANLTQDNVNLTNARYQFIEGDSQGKADKIALENQNLISLANATYSTCASDNEVWQLSADQVILDNKTSLGTANHVVLKLKSVPIFYLPTLSWVLKGRKTGILIPTYNSYSNSENDEAGSQVKVPYYVNIASDKDLLLTLNHLSTRGESVEAKYRQLFKNGDLMLAAGYLDEDEISKEKRWFFDSELDYNISDDLRFLVNTKQVSDQKYLSEIAHKDQSLSSLASNGLVSYEKNDWYIDLLAQTQQAVNDASTTYYRLPEVSVKKSLPLDDSRLDLSVVATKFRHKDSTMISGERQNSRFDYNKTLSKNQGYHLSSKLSGQSTQYQLNVDNKTVNKARDTLSFELAGHLNFEKRFDNQMMHLVKPKLHYMYTNKVDQSDLPLFDTTVRAFSYDALFEKSLFSGVDRLNHSNDVVVAVESDVIDLESGERLFNFKIGQRFHPDDIITSATSTLIDSDAVQTLTERRESDIALEINAKVKMLDFSHQLRWDPEQNKVVSHASELSYRAQKNQFMSMAHYKVDDENILQGYFSMPVSDNISVISSMDKSLTHNRIKKTSLGLIYDSCCWAFKVAHFEQYNGTTQGSDSFERVTKFELLFKGLGSTTPEMDETIHSYIPEYND